MLTTENVTLGFGQKNLFENVSLIFNPGYKYGVIGANGAGKSTFLKVLSGELTADKGTINKAPKARMGVLRQDHFKFDETTMLNAVYQGHTELWALMEERTKLYEKGENLSDAEGVRLGEVEGEFMEMDGYSAESKAGGLLAGLGVPEKYYELPMKEAPTNYKFRALLAQVLFAEPDIMLLDEPTNNLDIKSIGWLEDFLNEYEGTLLVVSHDRAFLNNVSTHICDIDFGRITNYAGDYDYYMAASAITRDNKLTDEAKRQKRMSELKSFIQRFGANKSKARQATSRKKQLENLLETEEVRPSSRVYPSIMFPMDRELGKDVVILDGVYRGYDGIPVLKNLNLQYQKGEKVAVIGPNGVGKSTLLKLLAGEIQPDKGEVRWGVTTKRTYCPQDVKAYVPKGVTLFNYLFNTLPNLDKTDVRGLLGRMLFRGEDGDKNTDVLSGGETVRLILARMMIEKGNVLLLDEPTNNLDLESIESLNTGLSVFQGTVFFVSHDRKFIESLATRVLEIFPNGEVIDYRGTYPEYLEFQKRKN
jgi:ATPase subunit of ABC transporter with duplicated ATPase domains